jgi:hypothetical protein
MTIESFIEKEQDLIRIKNISRRNDTKKFFLQIIFISK